VPDDASKRCSKCGEVKPLTEFYRAKRHPDGHRARCKDCCNEQRRTGYPAIRERVAAEHRDYRERNPEKVRESLRRWHEKNPDYTSEAGRQRNADLKAQVLAHYGDVCACCGTSDRLSIDHVNGDGRQHRTELFGHPQRGGTGTRYWAWLIQQGFPAGYQTLCRPCNSSKGTGERCRLTH
jgi:hypothetical protein